MNKEENVSTPKVTPEQLEALIEKGKLTRKALPDKSRIMLQTLQYMGVVKSLTGRYKDSNGNLIPKFKDLSIYKYKPRQSNKYIPHTGLRETQRLSIGGFAGKGYYYKSGLRGLRVYLDEGRYTGISDQIDVNVTLSNTPNLEVIYVPNCVNGYIDHYKCVRGNLKNMLDKYPRSSLVVDPRVQVQ